jgi:hypothetical protein
MLAKTGFPPNIFAVILQDHNPFIVAGVFNFVEAQITLITAG